jgi:hypothetical protein
VRADHDGTALSIVTHANSTSGTEVASASFNGTYTAPTFTNNNTYEILYTLGKVFFLINNVIIHTVSATTTHWTSNTTNFHAFADVVNTGDSSAVTMTIRMMNITRLGKLETAPTYKHIASATTTVCKRGGGVLHAILMNDPTNNKVTIYDDVAASPRKGSIVAFISSLFNKSRKPKMLAATVREYRSEICTGSNPVSAMRKE